MSSQSQAHSALLVSLGPDIDTTSRAIARVVGSLSSDPAEQAAIITAAASEAIEALRTDSLQN